MKESPLLKYNSKYKDILHSLILENIEERESPAILDVGCGKGDDLQRISHIDKRISGYGVDTSFDYLIVASEKLRVAKNLCLLQAKAELLPFKNESFDIVISSEVIEHIDIKRGERLIEEVYRVLKHQGVFIVTTPSRFNYTSLIGKIVPSYFKKSLRKLVYYLPQAKDEKPHVHIYSPRELKKIFEKKSFTVIKIESGALRVPIWPLFDKFPFLLWVWRCLDKFVDKLPFGIYLKLHFIIVGRKITKDEKNFSD